MSLSRCTRCDGFVPTGASSCPNCRSTRRAWWAAPVAMASAGLATVTLSACYGVACAVPVNVTLPDGSPTTKRSNYGATCRTTFDCRVDLPDGGDKQKDWEWKDLCESKEALDGGSKDGG